MLSEIPTISQHVIVPDHWGFRNFPRSNDLLISDHDLEKIELYFSSEIIKLKNNESTPVNVSINNSLAQGKFSSKGRWRAGLPSGILEFKLNYKSHKYYVIFEDFDHNLNNKYSELSNSELFDGEAYNYHLFNKISSNSLQNQVCNISISLGLKTKMKTRALFVEHFNFNAQVLAKIKNNTFINAADILNLHFLQSLISNQDYFFDFDEEGKFKVHNINPKIFDGQLVPIAYDFQFTAILTPLYQRHRNFNLIEEAVINGRNISTMIKKTLSVEFSHFSNAVELAISCAESRIDSDCLRNRYVTYLETYINTIKKEVGLC